jgi:exonuclease SbcC
MRPRSLRLHGFTCFSDEVSVDFTNMEVFVISGPTGAGKTTLIDAMCYALYGRVARDPGGRNISGLISHNRDELRVQFEFEAAGDVYRASRGFSVAKRTARDGTEKAAQRPAIVTLERRVNEHAWEPVIEHGGIKELNEAVERIVGLDFDAFTRCVLLPQGQFQEFLAGDANKRREILIHLLNTGIYERVRAAANARAINLKARLEANGRTLTQHYADATEEALAAAKQRVASAAPLLSAARDERDALNGAVGLAQSVVEARKLQRGATEERTKKLGEIARAEELARGGDEQLRSLKERLRTTEDEIGASPYDAERHGALQAALQAARHVEALTRQHAEAAAAAADEASLDAAKAAAASARKARGEAERSCREAEEALARAQRDDAAAHVRQALKQGDPCPVCGALVGSLPRAAASAVAAAERARDEAKKKERAAIAAAEKTANELAAGEQRHANASTLAQQRGDELERALDELAAQLPDGLARDAQAINAELDKAVAAKKNVDRLVHARDAARKEHDALAERVTESTRTIDRLRGEAEALEAQATRAKRDGDENISALIKQATARGWSEALAQINARKDPVAVLSRMRDERNDEVERLNQELASAQADEKRIAADIVKAAALRAECERDREGAQLYGELAQLLRSDRFQQFVLDEAMHILAETATEQLERLCPRFRIAVEKSDFMVVDAWQADKRRSARTLSGGETFVASLALALALSERLPDLQSSARNTLESLFLDEGFGTLDRETLNTVADALEELRSDERMVGIITHVPELVERIGSQRIVVTPAPGGSTLTVIGAG